MSGLGTAFTFLYNSYGDGVAKYGLLLLSCPGGVFKRLAVQ